MNGPVFKRIFAGIVILIAIIAFLVNAAGLLGIWIVRRPARDTVTTLFTFVNDKLGIVDQALARVSVRADEERQALARINSVANKLGDRFDQGSPMLPALSAAVRDDLAPRIADMRTQAAALHDGVMAFNTALETLDSLKFIQVPAFGDDLSAVSERVDAARRDIEEMRAAIDEARAAAPANLAAAVVARTTKIDNVMAQIKSTTMKYQSVVARKAEQWMDLSHRVLRAINLLVVSLTALVIIVAAGQVLLIYVCWQYVRQGRFPVLRASRE